MTTRLLPDLRWAVLPVLFFGLLATQNDAAALAADSAAAAAQPHVAQAAGPKDKSPKKDQSGKKHKQANEKPAKKKEAAEDSKSKPSKNGKPAPPEQDGKHDEPSGDSKDSAKSNEPKSSNEKEAEKPEDSKEAAEKKQSETIKLKKAPFRIDVSLEGVFESGKTAEIVLRPKTWSSFTVVKTVGHGTQVKAGDLLIACETDRIDEAIADLRTELRLMQLSMQQAQNSVRFLEKAISLDLEAEERSEKYAKEDLDRFTETTLPNQKKAADFMVKTAEDYVAYQREELEQLEKMYKADDLTEETEEIILRRARDALTRAEFSLKQARLQRDELLSVDLPRAETRMNDMLQQEKLSAAKAKVLLPAQLKEQKIEIEKLEVRLGRAREKLDELLGDRKLMNLRAPIDGIVYFGEAEQGEWSSIKSTTERLRQGSSLSEQKVLMTVVQPRPLSVRATVPEKRLHLVRAGIKGFATPSGYPQMKLSAIVAEVGNVPVSNTSYESRVTVALDTEAAQLMPGMKCTVKLRAYENKTALTVPASAVKTDVDNPERQFVMLVDGKKKRVERRVEVGRRTEQRLEILKGLSEGAVILKQFPKEED